MHGPILLSVTSWDTVRTAGHHSGMFTDLHCQVIICCGRLSALLLPHPHIPFYPTGQPAIPHHQAWPDRSHALSHTNKPYEHQNQLERDHDREKERANVTIFTLACKHYRCHQRLLRGERSQKLVGLLWPVLQWLKEEVVYCSCCPEPESCYQTMVFKKSVSCWFLWC